MTLSSSYQTFLRFLKLSRGILIARMIAHSGAAFTQFLYYIHKHPWAPHVHARLTDEFSEGMFSEECTLECKRPSRNVLNRFFAVQHERIRVAKKQRAE